MNFIDKVMEKWNLFQQKARPVMQKAGQILQKTAQVIKKIFKYIMRFRKIFLAIPVGWGAISLALYNMGHLPAVVGLDMQNNGEFSMLVVRELAVLGPLAITALCLLLMFASRRTLTPWIVSLFSLSLPLLILITNVFPS